MTADCGEENFPGDADGEGHDVNRQKIHRALNHVVVQAARVESGQQADQFEAPARLCSEQVGMRGEYRVGLVTNVPHAEEHGGERAQPYQNDHALEVETVAHMRGGAGDAGRAVQEGVHRLVKSMQLFIFAALLYMAAQRVHERSQAHDQPSFSMRVKMSRKIGPYSYLPEQV